MTSRADGSHFEDLSRGDVFDLAPPVTLTDGQAAAHQAILGNRCRLALDHGLSEQVTGLPRPVAAPHYVWDVAIGQSTTVTRHVVANLFYRGFRFHRAPVIGDTLRTRTEVVALRQNSAKPGRAATGLVALRITTTDQLNRTVLDFWRCAMLPLRDQDLQTGHQDDLAAVGPTTLEGDLTEVVVGWDLAAFRAALPAGMWTEAQVGTTWEVVGGDVVSSAPELARLTQNVARTHHDNAANPNGRLVYGGHTIGIALSQTLRVIPDLVTVSAWHGCAHLGPVQEGDTLSTRVSVEQVKPFDGGRLAHLRAQVAARSGRGEVPRDVLDWRFVVVLS